MERKMGKIVATLMLLVLVLTLCSGCSESAYTKVEMTFAQPHTEEVIYYNYSYEEYEFEKLEAVTAEWQEFLDTNGQALVDFLNEEYGSDWKYEPITAYGVDLSESGINFNIGGIYGPVEDCIYLDADMLSKSPSELTAEERGHVIHEEEHYIRALNTGDVVFGLKKGSGKVGRVFNEAMTNFICYKWLIVNGDVDAAQRYWEDGYATGMFFCQELELIIPDLVVYYLEDDIKSLSKDFNNLAKAHIKSSENNMFEAWLWQADKQYDAEHSFKTQQSQEAMIECMYYFLGNTEILAAMTEKSYGADFISNFKAYDEVYWETTYCIDDQFILYFETLFYEEIEE